MTNFFVSLFKRWIQKDTQVDGSESSCANENEEVDLEKIISIGTGENQSVLSNNVPYTQPR